MTQTNEARRINLLQVIRWLARQAYVSSDTLLPLLTSVHNEADFQRQRFWKRTKFLFISLCQSAFFILLVINTTLHIKSAFLLGHWWDIIILIFSFIFSLFLFLLPLPFLNGYIYLPAKAFVLRTFIDQREHSVNSDNASMDTPVSLPISLQVKATRHQKQPTFSLFDLGILGLSVASPLFVVVTTLQTNPMLLSPSDDNYLYYLVFISWISILASISIVPFRTIGLTLDAQGIAKRRHVWSTTTSAKIVWSDVRAFYTTTEIALTGETVNFYLLECSNTSLLWVVNQSKSSADEMQDSESLCQLISTFTGLQPQDISGELKAVKSASPHEIASPLTAI